jgi:predicted GNAT family acetyltransferase
MTDADTAASPETTVTRNDAKSRYELHLEGTVAGVATFEPDGHGRLVFPHTEIDPAFRERGLATLLIGEAMADAARRGDTVVPECPFVVSFLRENDVPGLTVHWRPTADDGGSDRIDASDR